MKILYYLFTAAAVILLFRDCHEKSRQSRTMPAFAGGTNVPDSVNVLDSLSYASRISDYQLSLAYGKRALSIAASLKKAEDMATAYTALGNVYIIERPDSGYFYYSKAWKIADSMNIVRKKPSLMYNLAMLQYQAYNFKTALLYLDSSVRLAGPAGDYEVMSSAYNGIGALLLNINDREGAKTMFDSAFTIAGRHSLFRQMGNAAGNKARMEKDSRKSVKLDRMAVGYLNSAKNTEEERALLLINIGSHLNDPDSALALYRSALDLAKRGNFVKVELGAYNDMAYSYLEKHEPEKALHCLEEHAIPMAKKYNNVDWLSTLYDSYTDVLSTLGLNKKALEFEKKAIEARVEADNQKATEQVRLLSVMLDLKNKELMIQRHERELLRDENRVQEMRLWLGILVFLIVVCIVIVIIMRLQHRARLQREQISSARTILQIEEGEKSKIAGELHDITGQLMLSFGGHIHALNIPDESVRTAIFSEIDSLSGNLRSISHRMSHLLVEKSSLRELITNLCKDIMSVDALHLSQSIPQEEPPMSDEVKLHVYRISQELLTNAAKYARHSQVVYSLSYPRGKLLLKYSDNGPGFDRTGKKENGIGIMNIFERTKLLGGKAFLDTYPENGVYWEISVPLI